MDTVKFSIPYNGSIGIIQEIISKYKRRIEEVYFPIAQNIAVTSKLNTKSVSRQEAAKLLKLLAENDVKSNILINGAYQGNRDPETMKDFIRSIGGVASITIADLYLLEVFKKFGPRLHISRVAQLNTVEKIRRILARYPDVSITLDTDLNRDIKALKQISSLKKHFPGFRVKLMVNEGCLFHCTGRSRHAWMLCLSQAEKRYKGSLFDCFYQVTLDEIHKEMVKSPFIRPEDLNFYTENRVVDIFKIAGRQLPAEALLKVVEAYMRGYHKGSLLELMGTGVMRSKFPRRYAFDMDNRKFPADFAGKVTACDKFCASCVYCAAVADAVICTRGAGKKIHMPQRVPT